MKSIISFIVLIFFGALTGNAQNMEPAPEDKAVVYFVRPSSFGALINFSYFDSTTLIGRFKGPRYIRYECEPGQHLFWGRSENKDFVEANLEAGKVYMIEAVVMMGGIKAGLRLEPINQKTKNLKKINKLLGKRKSESFSHEELEEDTRDLEGVIERGMDKYQEMKKDGELFKQLEKEMYFEL